MDVILRLLQEPLILAIGAIVGSLFAAWFIELVITKILGALASRTKTDVDDQIVEILRRPIFLSVLVYGVDWAVDLMSLPERLATPTDALLKTLIIVSWAIACTRMGVVVLSSLAARESKRSMLQPRTLPVFDILMRILVVAGAIYFMFLAWDIDLTAWLASAGILGVAFGFAAKDTLANLFAGIFILADAPYKVRDWVTLDENLRGEVTHIGMRSTRLLTPDDVEINVPNAVIGNSQLINETSGPNHRQRLRIKFWVAFGTDVDHVREVGLASVEGAPRILFEPEAAAPKVRLRSLNSWGLDFELSVWIQDPTVREVVIDDVTTRLYKALMAANIDIPYPKRELYIKEMPK